MPDIELKRVTVLIEKLQYKRIKKQLVEMELTWTDLFQRLIDDFEGKGLKNLNTFTGSRNKRRRSK